MPPFKTIFIHVNGETRLVSHSYHDVDYRVGEEVLIGVDAYVVDRVTHNIATKVSGLSATSTDVWLKEQDGES